MRSTPIISIVGKSASGKTCFIETIIPRLKERGLKIGTIKHDVHGFDIDKPGKDTWRHKKSGASMVIISSPQKVAIIRDVEEEYTVDRIRDEFGEGFDLILTEGYKRGDKPKIEIHRPSKHRELLCSPTTDHLLKVVHNKETSKGEASFDQEEIEEVIEIIVDFVKKERKNP